MEIAYSTSRSVDDGDVDLALGGAARQVRMAPLEHPSFLPFLVQWQLKLRSMSLVEWMELHLPCTRWLRTYRWREFLLVDLIAGITVGVMLVPQAMSYAKLAGLHPIYGLYSGFVPILVYALFGSSHQLAIGPVTLVSLLVSNALSRIIDPSEELYTELAMLLALMVGALECMMGLLRLGCLLSFVGHPVISGFIAASAIIIALSQTKYFLGYNIERSSKILPLVRSIIAGAGDFSRPPFVMGSTLLAIILVMKQLGKMKENFRFLSASGPFAAVILGTAFMKIYHPSSISVVGEVPEGLPTFHIPRGLKYAESLISTTVLITGVALLESMGIAKSLAAKNGCDLDSNKELFGLGMANICGSFFSAYPTTGALSRSAVNHESGAKTGLSGIATGLTIVCVLLFLTPLLRDIPQCALAAVVISVGINMVDYEEAIFLWQVDKKDFLLWTITCLTTSFLGAEIGVLVGVSSSLAFVLRESAIPSIAVLGRLPGTTVYRNIEQYPEAYVYSGIIVVQIDAPIYFANIRYIKDRLREYKFNVSGSTKNGQESERIYFVIIDMTSVSYIDSSAVKALRTLHQEYKSHGLQIAISNPNRRVLLTLSRGGVIDMTGENWYFVSVHDAVKACLQKMHNFHGSTLRIGDWTGGRQPGFLQRQWKQQLGDEPSSYQEPLLS